MTGMLPSWNEFRGLYNVDPRTIDGLPTELFPQYFWSKEGLKPPDLKEQQALVRLVHSTCKKIDTNVTVECETSFNDRTASISFRNDEFVNEKLFESLRASLKHAPYWRLLFDPALYGMEVLIYPSGIVYEGQSRSIGQHLDSMKKLISTSSTRVDKFHNMQLRWIKKQIQDDADIFQKMRVRPIILGAFDNGQIGRKQYRTLEVWSLEYRHTVEACWMDGMEVQTSYKGMTQLSAGLPNQYDISRDGSFVPFTGKNRNQIGFAVCNGFDLSMFEGYVCFRDPANGEEVTVEVALDTILTLEALERYFCDD